MEFLLFLFVFVFYIAARLLLGHHRNAKQIDTTKYKQGISWVEQKQYVKALHYFENILAENIHSGVAWAYRGRCHFELGNYYQALADCSKALDIDYSLRDCYLVKGKSLLALEEYQDAIWELDKAAWHFQENHAEIFRFRGLCYYKLEQYKKAQQDFNKAVLLQDEHANYFLLKMKNRLDVIE